MIPVKDTSSGASFAVRVQPRAKKSAITGAVGDALKIAITAPPIEGKANAACIDLLSTILKVPRSSITIAAGQTSRNKVVRVAGLSASEVSQRIALLLADDRRPKADDYA
jgi:hypothetical protein